MLVANAMVLVLGSGGLLVQAAPSTGGPLVWTMPSGSGGPAVASSVVPSTPPTGTNLSVSLTTTTPAVDVGEPVVLVAVVSGGTPPYSCHWWQNETDLGQGPCNSWTVSTGATGVPSFSVSAQDATGKRGRSGPLAVPVSPALNARWASDPQQLEVGLTANFSLLVQNGTGSPACSWWLDGTSIASTGNCTALSLVPSSAGTHVLSVVAKDQASPAESVQAQVTLTVLPPLVVALSSSVLRPMVGQQVVLAAEVSGGAAPLQFAWTLNGTAIGANGSTFEFLAAHSASYTFQVTVMDTLGARVQGAPLEVQVASTASPSGGGKALIALPRISVSFLDMGLVVLVAMGLALLLFAARRRARSTEGKTSAGTPPRPGGKSSKTGTKAPPMSTAGPSRPPDLPRSPKLPPRPHVPAQQPKGTRAIASAPARALPPRPAVPGSSAATSSGTARTEVLKRRPEPDRAPRRAPAAAPHGVGDQGRMPSLGSTPRPAPPKVPGVGAGPSRSPALGPSALAGPRAAPDTAPSPPPPMLVPGPVPVPVAGVSSLGNTPVGRQTLGEPSGVLSPSEPRVLPELPSLSSPPPTVPAEADPASRADGAKERPPTLPAGPTVTEAATIAVVEPDLPVSTGGLGNWENDDEEMLVGQACPWVPLPSARRSTKPQVPPEMPFTGRPRLPEPPPSSSPTPAFEVADEDGSPPSSAPMGARCERCGGSLSTTGEDHRCTPESEIEDILSELAREIAARTERPGDRGS